MTRSLRGFAVLLLAVLAQPAMVRAQVVQAASQSQPVQVELGATHESLTNNLPDWSSVYLEAARTFRPRHTLYGGLRETRRFGLDDTEANLGLYYPLSDQWTGLIEATASPEHNVLAKYSVLGQLQRELAPGVNLSAGFRESEYSASRSRLATLGAEMYRGSFRAAYTFYSGRPEGASSAPAHRFQANYYYGDRNTIGIAYTHGREVESVGPPVGLITSKVRDWTLTGRHWLSADWALSYDLLTHEQGVLYRRQGLRLGLRHQF